MKRMFIIVLSLLVLFFAPISVTFNNPTNASAIGISTPAAFASDDTEMTGEESDTLYEEEGAGEAYEEVEEMGDPEESYYEEPAEEEVEAQE